MSRERICVGHDKTTGNPTPVKRAVDGAIRLRTRIGVTVYRVPGQGRDGKEKNRKKKKKNPKKPKTFKRQRGARQLKLSNGSFVFSDRFSRHRKRLLCERRVPTCAHTPLLEYVFAVYISPLSAQSFSVCRAPKNKPSVCIIPASFSHTVAHTPQTIRSNTREHSVGYTLRLLRRYSCVRFLIDFYGVIFLPPIPLRKNRLFVDETLVWEKAEKIWPIGFIVNTRCGRMSVWPESAFCYVKIRTQW